MTEAHSDPGYPTRREAEVRHLLTSLSAELGDWKKAAKEQGPLEKHRSQVESAVRVISAALERLNSMPTAERQARAPELVLDLHHLWDFFRTKLMLRHNPRYKAFLDVADELAWAVYNPIRQAAASRLTLREPPLTFLSRQPVPFAAARGSNFEGLLPDGKQRTLDGRKASTHLPFPVIGIPWSASRHLPTLLSVAHETGHHIEDDFKLTQTLLARLREDAGLPPHRTAVWERWLGEVFADVCGTLACGRAYIWTLTDAITAAGADTGTGSEEYPPPRLRVLVCLAALPAGDTGPMPTVPGLPEPWDAEAEAVAAALTDKGLDELGGRTLATLIGLRWPERLAAASDRLRTEKMLSRRSDVAGVLAAATLVFVHDPAEYDEKSVGERALNEVLGLVPKGPRPAKAGEHLLLERDTAAGRKLIDLLSAGS